MRKQKFDKYEVIRLFRYTEHIINSLQGDDPDYSKAIDLMRYMIRQTNRWKDGAEITITED